ncbi:Replication factor C subunit 5 [Astathelohania contejeani]|uniref:Replication factor C subunit 5 n=1 Tax=Astathelohania contejeani TaxID=164912 RepID=A0ABQ7I154_9MICR|nr:Replication factor C subunit 5 [Thelohania contejeani]
MNNPFTEKYRPTHLKDILGNSEVIESLENMLKYGSIPHMLFYGPPGTGKTTAIRAMARQLYPTHYHSNVLEMNASDDRGIDTVRDSIKSFASTVALKNKKKIIILDEADAMSRDAQNALRRIIEDFSSNTRFCIIANYSNKLIPAILSRCTKFRFAPVESDQIAKRITNICLAENIEITPDGIDALIHMSSGDMRKLMNDIEGIACSFKLINKTNVYTFCGLADEKEFKDLFDCMLNDRKDIIQSKIKMLMDIYSLDLDTIITQLSELVIKSDMKNKMKIIKELAAIEYNLSIGCGNSIQMNGVVAAFLGNK